MRLTDAAPEVRHDGHSVIRLAFEIDRSARRETLDLSHIRLYLDADTLVAFALHHALTRQVRSVALRLPAVREGAATELAKVRLEPAGFAAHERLWPKADAAFSGYQLLLECFTFREKFLFVDVRGLDLRNCRPTPGVLNSMCC